MHIRHSSILRVEKLFVVDFWRRPIAVHSRIFFYYCDLPFFFIFLLFFFSWIL
jgi:hypothetical protein